jgi:hypothetical protein
MQRPSGDEDEMEYVAFIHNILRIDPEDGDTTRSFALVVSRYSSLQSTPPFSFVNTALSINRKELLLYFSDFETMGQPQDAEIIFVDDILHAQDLELTPSCSLDPVKHLTRVPESMRPILRDTPATTPANINTRRSRGLWVLLPFRNSRSDRTRGVRLYIADRVNSSLTR